jgi:hypothetical protein
LITGNSQVRYLVISGRLWVVMSSDARGGVMKSPVAHWGSREWRKNMDDLVPDPARPQAFPSTYPMDLMGRIRVKLCAEDGNLVAYGFGGQRVALPPKSVGTVVTVSAFRAGRIAHGRALLVLDHDDQILLRADGRWETYGEVQKVCRAAKVPSPTHVSPALSSKTQARHGTRGRRPPRFVKAPGYVRLRTYPHGVTLRVLALIVLFLVVAGLGGFIGVLPAVALPEWFGAVRTLIGIVGVLLGLAGGLWVAAAIAHVLADAVRWAAVSWAAGTPAPPARFFGRRREHPGAWLTAAKVGLVLLFFALVGWGPGVGIASLAHGFRDSSLVADLRANGTTIPGTLIDVPEYSTDSDGNTTETDVPTLSFLFWKTTDPSIGGRPLPLDAANPINTDVPETVVYLPNDPGVAAAEQQITGSVWHGAPTANLISGGLFTLALPPLLWFLVLLARRRRSRRARQFVDDLTA